MEARITDKELEEGVAEIAEKTGLPLYINWCYNQPQLYRRVPSLTSGTNETNCAQMAGPRLSRPDFHRWMMGILTGIDFILEKQSRTRCRARHGVAEFNDSPPQPQATAPVGESR